MTAHLATFLESYIAALSEGTPWLFPSLAAQSGHTVEIRKPFRRVVRAAGLDPDEVVRHTLRHTAITHLVLHHSKFDGCYGHGVQSGQPIYMEDDQHAHEKISRDTQGR